MPCPWPLLAQALCLSRSGASAPRCNGGPSASGLGAAEAAVAGEPGRCLLARGAAGDPRGGALD
eukprot:11204339-Lingulodinium_polyedra.AAC.1